MRCMLAVTLGQNVFVFGKCGLVNFLSSENRGQYSSSSSTQGAIHKRVKSLPCCLPKSLSKIIIDWRRNQSETLLFTPFLSVVLLYPVLGIVWARPED